jgi:signal transduction histidine kinase
MSLGDQATIQDPHRAKATASTLALLAAAYYFGAQAALFIGTLSDRIFAPFWPPYVILLYALLMAPPRRWWMYIAAAFPAHVVAEIGVDMPPVQYLVAFATNCAVAILSAYGVRRFMVGPEWFSTLRQAGTYVVAAVVLSPALCALGGALVPLMSEGKVPSYWISWPLWYGANALGAATLGPFLLTWFAQATPPRQLASRRAEASFLQAGLIVMCAIVFGAGPWAMPGRFVWTLLYLPLPFVIWAAIRFGDKGVSAAVPIVALVSIWRNLQGSTVFDDRSVEVNTLALQVFLTAFSVPVLLLGATIEQLRRAEDRLRALAGTLLHGQDLERRGIARGLHEGTGQNLAGASLIARRLQHNAPEAMRQSVGELAGILQQSVRELRTMSGQLHPLLLDEMGLAPALRSYVNGFVEHSGIAVDLVLPAEMERWSAGIELALFRVVQEALTNVSRHSGSTRARIHMRMQGNEDARELTLTVEDFGRGFQGDSRITFAGGQIASSCSAGLGLRRVCERLRHVGGDLRIDSSLGRTAIAATVPLRPAGDHEDLVEGRFDRKL